MFRLTVFLVMLVLMVRTGQAASVPTGPVIAETGFNDVSGIHSDGMPNSPYEFGLTIHGRSALEPGWAGTRVVSKGGSSGGQWGGTAESTDPLEGDGVLYIHDADQDMWVYRTFQVTTDVVLIDQFVRVESGGRLISRTWGPGGTPVHTRIASTWTTSGNKFFAFDGDTFGGGSYEDTGFDVVPNQWHKVSVLIDVPERAYRFFVDDQEYNGPDRLNFQNRPTSIVGNDYMAKTKAWVDLVRVSAIPEPSTLALLTIGALGLLAYGWRREDADQL